MTIHCCINCFSNKWSGFQALSTNCGRRSRKRKTIFEFHFAANKCWR